MTTLEEKVELLVKEINALHDSTEKSSWASLSRNGFVLELEKNTLQLKNIHAHTSEINKELKMLMEKNTPNLDNFLEDLTREIMVLDKNITLEQNKRIRTEIINEKEAEEIPELYSSLQHKILTLSLKARYNTEKIRNFILAKKTPFVKKGTAAKNLLEILQTKENELTELKTKNIELKRKNFMGPIGEKNVAEIEAELQEMDKHLSETVLETKKSLKSHFAQINYVEGSFISLKNKVEEIQSVHAAFTKHAITLIKELKKERDYAKTFSLEIEQETLHKRSEYTKKILEIEEKKQAIEERLNEKHEKENAGLKKLLAEKEANIKHLHKLIEKLENEIKAAKK